SLHRRCETHRLGRAALGPIVCQEIVDPVNQASVQLEQRRNNVVVFGYRARSGEHRGSRARRAEQPVIVHPRNAKLASRSPADKSRAVASAAMVAACFARAAGSPATAFACAVSADNSRATSTASACPCAAPCFVRAGCAASAGADGIAA